MLLLDLPDLVDCDRYGSMCRVRYDTLMETGEAMWKRG